MMINWEVMASLRKAFGIPSPMNVWKKMFVWSIWAHTPELPEAKVGTVITIKKPARYFVRQEAITGKDIGAIVG